MIWGGLVFLVYLLLLGIPERHDDLDNLSEVWYTVNGVRTKAYAYSYTKSGQLHSLEDFTNNTVTVYRYDEAGSLFWLH